jgi:hypothetical protein
MHKQLLVTEAKGGKGRVPGEGPTLLNAKSAMQATTGSATVIPAFFPAQTPHLKIRKLYRTL